MLQDPALHYRDRVSAPVDPSDPATGGVRSDIALERAELVVALGADPATPEVLRFSRQGAQGRGRG